MPAELPLNDRAAQDGSVTGSHTPVLLEEVLDFVKPSPGKNYIDGTTGPGNMSRAILEKCSPDGRVLSIDCDPRVSSHQEEKLGGFGNRSVRRLSNFASMLEIAREEDFLPADGIILDLGLSSVMLDLTGYGMSFQRRERLDMRFDPELTVTAYDLVNNLPVKELTELLRGMDEGRFGGRIARVIERRRKESPIETTEELADVVASAVPRRFHPRHMHVATRTFLALRAEVNRERESLEKVLDDAVEILGTGGVLVVICYSSFEDRIVKAAYSNNRDRWERMTRKPVTPGQDEIERNPRSRSARLRAYRKAA